MPTITPFLWFDDDLDDAIAFYAMVFADAVVQGTVPGPEGKTLAADFEIGGQAVKAINGGPQFPQTEAFSFFVECDGQAESIATGQRSPPTAARRVGAGGSKTASASPGRSSPPSSAR